MPGEHPFAAGREGDKRKGEQRLDESRSRLEREDLREEVRQIWDAQAEWWDDKIGDGNDFQRELVEPATERLIGDVAGATVLDVACGGGRFGRRMAELGAHVVGIDISESFIRRARQRVPAHLAERLEYHVVDAADREALLLLGTARFDGAVATMALMDMAVIEPLFEALPAILKPGGCFVFTLFHPCFEAPGVARFAESVEDETGIKTSTGVKMSRYLTPEAYRGIGILGQARTHYYFHRPLQVLLGAGFRNGLVVDALEEPAYAPTDEPATLNSVWYRPTEIPRVLAVRMRVPRG